MNSLWKHYRGFGNVCLRCRLHVISKCTRNTTSSSWHASVVSSKSASVCRTRTALSFRVHGSSIVLLSRLHTDLSKPHRVLSSTSTTTHLPSVRQIEQFLASKNVKFEHGHTAILAQCSFCLKSKKKDNKPDLSLFINKTTGSHFCRNCGASGSWRQFKVAVLEKSDVNVNKVSQEKALAASRNEETDLKVAQLWSETLPLSKYNGNGRHHILDKFAIKGLSDAMLDRYQVHVIKHKFSEPDGSVKEHLCVAFPWYDAKKQGVRGIKLIKTHHKSVNEVTLQPRQGFLGLFGWNTIEADAKEVVLTLNEFDAIAVNQATSYPAISLPLGTHSLPPEVLPQLEQFQRIILWFGSDVHSKQAANQFSRKLNIQRCHFVRPTDENPPTGALDALNKGCDLQSLITSAQSINHEKIVTFHQLRNEVYGELVNADQVAGVKWSRFPKLTSILKGHRRGELTIFTGPTGAGKTTLLSELSLDLCQSGVNTLWGSFEIRNVRLIKAMLNQLSGINLQKSVQQFNYWADKFEMLPMYFMCFYGSQNITSVIETMAHAAYVYDIHHIIIDNLQFMTSNVRSDDRYSVHNQAIGAFRDFASTKNVHVTLVIHPRKENDDVELQTASIFGTAKASQEADNVMILQDKRGRTDKYLQITKNRFDGAVGRVPLDFVKDSLSLSGFGKITADVKKSPHPKKPAPPFKRTRVVTDMDMINVSGPAPIGRASFRKPNSPGNASPTGDIQGGATAASGVSQSVATPPEGVSTAVSSQGGAAERGGEKPNKNHASSGKDKPSPVTQSRTPKMYRSFQGRIVSQVSKALAASGNKDSNGPAGTVAKEETSAARQKNTSRTNALSGTKLQDKSVRLPNSTKQLNKE